MVALDAKTGKVVWERPVEDCHTGYYSTMAPLIVKGKVMVGVSGGEFGVRGFVAGLRCRDRQPGLEDLHHPRPRRARHDTWQGDTWKRGGGSTWMTGTYDPDTNLTFWGIGNASPWFGDQRPGDNLYTASTIAIDPRPVRSRGTSSTTGTTPGTGTR